MIGVVLAAGLWSFHLFEDQHVAWLQLQQTSRRRQAWFALRVVVVLFFVALLFLGRWRSLFTHHPAIAQRRGSGALRQAALLIAPGVKINLVVCLEQLNRFG